MTERIKFDGIEGAVEVNFDEPHSAHQAALYAFDQHRVVVSMESDDGLGISDVLARLGEHRFSCEELIGRDDELNKEGRKTY